MPPGLIHTLLSLRKSCIKGTPAAAIPAVGELLLPLDEADVQDAYREQGSQTLRRPSLTVSETLGQPACLPTNQGPPETSEGAVESGSAEKRNQWHPTVVVGDRGCEKEDRSLEVFSIRSEARAYPKAHETRLNSARSRNWPQGLATTHPLDSGAIRIPPLWEELYIQRLEGRLERSDDENPFGMILT